MTLPTEDLGHKVLRIISTFVTLRYVQFASSACRHLTAFAVLSLSSLAPVHAQELRPLSEYAALPQERQSMSYFGVRCAGLYQGIWDYGGASLPSGMGETTQSSITILMRWAAVQRLQTQLDRTGALPDASAVSEQVMKEVILIADRYLARIEQNYTTTGEAWGSDTLIQSDMSLCGPLVEEVFQAYPSLR